MYTPGGFATIFTRQTIFVTSCLVLCTPILFEKGSTLKGKNLLTRILAPNKETQTILTKLPPKVSNLFLVREALFTQGTWWAGKHRTARNIPASILRKSTSGRHRPDIDLRRMLTGIVSLVKITENLPSVSNSLKTV